MRKRPMVIIFARISVDGQNRYVGIRPRRCRINIGEPFTTDTAHPKADAYVVCKKYDKLLVLKNWNYFEYIPCPYCGNFLVIEASQLDAGLDVFIKAEVLSYDWAIAGSPTRHTIVVANSVIIDEGFVKNALEGDLQVFEMFITDRTNYPKNKVYVHLFN